MIRGQTRELEESNVSLNASIHNRFDIEVIDAVTGEVKQRAQAENVILNNLWEYMFSSKVPWNIKIAYGTGSGTPAPTDTGLFTFLGYGTPTFDDVKYSADGKTASITSKIVLSETTAVGSVLTEVGIAQGTTNSTLCTHAMLKDMNGNQISIQKTNTDIINIYATVFAHFTADVDGVYFLKNRRSSLVNFMLGTNTNLMKVGWYLYPYGSYTNYSTTHDLANKRITINSLRYDASSSNDGHGTIALGDKASSEGGIGIVFVVPTAGVPSSTILGEAIGTGDGVAKDFVTKFEYIRNATIYVNGVADPTATIDAGRPITALDALYKCGIIEMGVGDQEYRASSWMGVYKNSQMILENKNCGDYGFLSFTSDSQLDIYVSDDLTNWTQVANTSGKKTIESQYRRYRYWKFVNVNYGTYGSYITEMELDVPTSTNIHFATAPASGAVITADYTTDTIAKDSNHVFDLTVVLQFGEYTT